MSKAVSARAIRDVVGMPVVKKALVQLVGEELSHRPSFVWNERITCFVDGRTFDVSFG